MPSVDLSPETLARLEAQLQADLDAVRRVRALLAAPKISAHPSPAPAAPVAAEEKIAPATAMAPSAPTAPPPPAYVPPPPTSVAVPQAVAFMEGAFSLDEVREMLHHKHLGGHAQRDVRAILNKMVKSGELRVASVGRGRGGSTYQRVTPG